MKKTDISCDICQDLLKHDCERPIKPFIGIKIELDNHLISENYNNTTKHLCLNCVKDIVNIYENDKEDFNQIYPYTWDKINVSD